MRGAMFQQLGALVLVDVPGSVHSTRLCQLTNTCNSTCRGYDALF